MTDDELMKEEQLSGRHKNSRSEDVDGGRVGVKLQEEVQVQVMTEKMTISEQPMKHA